MIKSRENTIGAWAFLIGVVLAILIGLSAKIISIPTLTKYSTQMYAILLLLGIVVGYMNAVGKDTHTFLIAGAVLIIASKFGMDSVTGSLIGFEIAETVKTVFSALLTLFVPATIIVALKTVFSIAKL
jgi:hypothetical protein